MTLSCLLKPLNDFVFVTIRMPWRGDADSMIDRFDVRAHLDTLPPPSNTSPKLTAEEDWEERQANYERYRILIQNDFLGSEFWSDI